MMMVAPATIGEAGGSSLTAAAVNPRGTATANAAKVAMAPMRPTTGKAMKAASATTASTAWSGTSRCWGRLAHRRRTRPRPGRPSPAPPPRLPRPA